jgi:hypothetical protein
MALETECKEEKPPIDCNVISFYPRKPFNKMPLAGLLTCSRSGRLPASFEAVAKIVRDVERAHSSGTVADFHGIPF